MSSTLQPSVHIIIVSYFGSTDLKRCLPELAHTVVDHPVTIVDNAASDEALDWITQQFPSWHLLRNSQNLGFGHANNVAAKTSDADYLVFLNPDTIPTEGWLDELIRGLEETPNAALATSKIILLSEPDSLNTAGNSVHLSGLTTCRGIRAPLEAFDKREFIAAVSGACFAIRRTVFEALNGFDDLFFMYMEDTDLSLRAILRGYHILYVPTSRIYHDYELKLGDQKIYLQERNRYLMLFKLFKWQTYVLLLPALMMGEAITWGFLFLQERRSIRNKLRAYLWVFKNWQLLQQRRRETQASRVVQDRELLKLFDARLDVTQFGSTPTTRFAESSIAILSSLYRRMLLGLVRW